MYYEGEHNGMTYQSLYPNLYSVTYTWVNPASHRLVTSTVLRTGLDEYHVRERVTRNADVRGEVTVEFVKALGEKVK